MTIADASFETVTQTPRARRRSLADLLAPLEKIAAHSPNLVANHEAHFEIGGETYELPRYLFVGPKGGDTPIRVGIFAAIHGDEPEGAHAIVQFIKLLEAKPELAAGYYLSFYPVCNPTGFEDGTRLSRSGRDLNREFWKNYQRAGSPAAAGRTHFPFVSRHHFAAHRRYERRFLRLRARRDADEASHRTRIGRPPRNCFRATSAQSLTVSRRATASFTTLTTAC